MLFIRNSSLYRLYMKYKYLVCGAGGFIGGHLVSRLINQRYEVVCADVKPKDFGFNYLKK